jgi:pimeloyl-ACP methyl ester carboxylesterase
MIDMAHSTTNPSTGTVRSSDGTVIAFDRAGAGAPIVYVAGATQYRAISRGGVELTTLLAPRFTVVTYDRRGRGDSGNVEPYAVEREIEDLDALITAVGGSAFVFGESSGAVLALEAAVQGLAITRLACYEPPFIVDDSRPPMSDDYAARFGALVAEGRRADAFELFMTVAVGLPADLAAGIRHDPMWPALESVTHTIAYDGHVMGDTQRGDPAAIARFATVAVPTLVIAGGDSPGHQHNAVRVLAGVLTDARLLTLPGESHQFTPAVLAPVLAAFFDQT